MSGELDEWRGYLSACGLALRLGVPVEPPELPRSRRMRKALQADAENNTRIRAALDAAKPKRRRRINTSSTVEIF